MTIIKQTHILKNNVKRLIKRLRLGSLKEFDFTQSYLRHNDEYKEDEAINRERKYHKKNSFYALNKDKKLSPIYFSKNSVGNILDNKITIKKVIDLGSGSGWFVNFVDQNYSFIDNIYAIEPSRNAIEISKNIYGEKSKVNYLNQYAHISLQGIKKDKYLITSHVVFLHLPRRYTKKILKIIDKICEKDSLLIFYEPIGTSFLNNYYLHNAKSQKFWKNNLKNFHVSFEKNNLIFAKKITS